MRALLASRSLGGFMHGGTDVGVVTAWESLCNLRESAAPTLRESESHRPHRSHPHRSPKSVPPLAPISEDAEERGSNTVRVQYCGPLRYLYFVIRCFFAPPQCCLARKFVGGRRTKMVQNFDPKEHAFFQHRGADFLQSASILSWKCHVCRGPKY